ncbi:oligosaccharide flippase family protein [Aerococcus urinaeequi]|uniref:Oligosaccharide flippase family protein n=1 Tax=Aerococcus urinaeequi TaxID=51665 RepID=A0AA47G7X2_9LACT|nr:oligosaccharide flippase family protein [Aerococcus urinaeequi]WAT23970.1 oligosaccharide flippase family protein [Aerococcus urinaeequi]
MLKGMSVYSFYIFINMVVDQVNKNVDITLLGRYSGTLITAVYSVGERMELIYQQISTSISNVFTPRVHRMVVGNISDWDLTLFFTKV